MGVLEKNYPSLLKAEADATSNDSMIAYEKCTPTETSELARHRRLCRKRLNPQTEYISKLAAVLNVSVDYLLGHENGGKQKGGPVGKARRVFEEVSELPRHQQQRILGIVEDLIAARGTTR